MKDRETKEVFSSSSSSIVLIYCCLYAECISKKKKKKKTQRQSIISEWLHIVEHIHCCEAGSDKESCQKQYASNYTWSPSKSALLDTSCTLSLCSFHHSASLCLSSPMSGTAARSPFEYVLKYRSALCYVCSCGGTHKASLSVSPSPMIQLPCRPLIINRCTLSSDKHLASKR